jgi:gliding motility-associated-like protein
MPSVNFMVFFVFSALFSGWHDRQWTVPNQDEGGSFLGPGIETYDNYTVEELVKNIFAKGTCDNISNVSSFGHPGGIGYFEGGENVINLSKGIILATGSIHHAKGPNLSTDKSGNFGDTSGDVDLNLMATNSVRDAVGIEFDFVPLDSLVTFRYVFASEEYCEFVGSIYNDVFGFFISGPGIEGGFSNNSRNVALIPGTEDFVAINSVNHLSNSNYYVGNEIQGDAVECGLPYTTPPFYELIEYDGFTRKLTALLRLIPCETYHIRLVVADVGDHFYDSAVFLEAESFNIGGAVRLSSGVEGNSDNIVKEGCQDGYFLFEREEGSTADFPLTVGIKVSELSTAEAGVDFVPLPLTVTIPAGQQFVKLPVEVFNDNVEEPIERLALELDIPCGCYTDTAQLLIKDSPPVFVNLPDVAVCQDGYSELSPMISEGTPGYSYQWSNQATSSWITVSALGPMQYSVTVTDRCGNSDSDTAAVIITQPPEAFLSGYAEICEGDTAFLQVDFTGIPPWTLTYSVDGQVQPALYNIQDSLFDLPATLGGLYEIVSFSDAACEGPSSGSAFIDLMHIDVDVLVEAVTCYGLADGSISLQVSGGTSPYVFSWSQGLGPGAFQEDLLSGLYDLTIVDARGCRKALQVAIPTPAPLSGIIVNCDSLANGILGLHPSGGTPPYVYSVNGSGFAGASVFDGLDPGEQYVLVIRDANGCQIEQDFLMPAVFDKMVELEDLIELKVGEIFQLQPRLFIPESLIANVRWIPDENLSCADCLYPEFVALHEQVFTLRIIDWFGCREEAVIQIQIDPAVDIFIPTAFSPNGDRINDRFIVYANAFQVQRIQLFRVFDRWGGMVFEARDFPPNDSSRGWDGAVRGKQAGNGVYTYFVQVELADGSEAIFKGNVALFR